MPSNVLYLNVITEEAAVHAAGVSAGWLTNGRLAGATPTLLSTDFVSMPSVSNLPASWSQREPSHFQRLPVGTERLHSHWHALDCSDVVAVVEVTGKLVEPSQALERLRHAWKGLRLSLPLIGASQSRAPPAIDQPFVFTIPNDAEATQWAKDTVTLLDRASVGEGTLQEYITAQKVNDHWSRVFYLPQEIGASLGRVSCHHSALDGRGALSVLDSLVDALALPVAGLNASDWAASASKLPATPSALSGIRAGELSPEGQQYLQRWAAAKPAPQQMFAMPTLAIAPAQPARPAIRLLQLDEARTTKLIANIKQHGYTVTEAYASIVQVAIAGACRAAGQQDAGKSIMSGDVIDVRRWLGSSELFGAASVLAFSFTPVDKLLAADAELSSATPSLAAFWDVVAGMASTHEVYRKSKLPIETEPEAVAGLVEVFKHTQDFRPIMKGASIISAVGLVDGSMVTPNHGDLTISAVNVTNLSHSAVSCVHSWTYRGRFNVQLHYEASCYDAKLIDDLHDRISAILHLLTA